MGEAEGVTGMQVRGYLLLVGLGLDLVGDEHHDEVGLFSGFLDRHDLQASLFGSLGALGARTQADADIAARVLEVQCVGMALGAITDDGNLLALDDLGVHVLLVQDFNSHFFSPSSMTGCTGFGSCILPRMARPDTLAIHEWSGTLPRR